MRTLLATIIAIGTLLTGSAANAAGHWWDSENWQSPCGTDNEIQVQIGGSGSDLISLTWLLEVAEVPDSIMSKSEYDYVYDGSLSCSNISILKHAVAVVHGVHHDVLSLYGISQGTMKISYQHLVDGPITVQKFERTNRSGVLEDSFLLTFGVHHDVRQRFCWMPSSGKWRQSAETRNGSQPLTCDADVAQGTIIPPRQPH